MDTNENIPYDVVLLSTHEEALAYREQVAAHYGPQALFGVTVSTVSSWLADLWELFGDGRAIATDVQRKVVSVALCRDAGANPGMPNVVAQCLSQGSGLDEFEQALKQVRQGCDARLSAAECEVLRLCEKAYASYRSLGLVEAGQAAQLICDRLPQRFSRIYAKLHRPLTLIEQRFLHGVGLTVVVEDDSCAVIGKAPDNVSVRFGYPSGRYAQARLIVNEVLNGVSGGNAVVASKDPLAMFSSCERALTLRGMSSSVRGRVMFPQTDFGRAFFAVRAFLGGDTWKTSDLADFLLSPFSGMPSSLAYALDARVRSDRLISRDELVMELRARSRVFELLEEITADPEADILIGALEDVVGSMTYRSEAWRQEQLRALAALREITSAARLAGLSMEECVSLLEKTSFLVSRFSQASGALQGKNAASEHGNARVTFIDYSQCGSCADMPCSLVVAADLTSAAFPASDADAVSTALLEKLGIPPSDDALSRARRSFAMLESMPTRELFVVRCLNDVDAEPTYPAAVLEEFVDCYRSDPSQTDDIDNAYALPPALMKGIVERGEELLVENAAESGRVCATAARIHVPDTGEVSPSMRGYVVLPRIVGHNVVTEPCLSPSQIESYLECPYKWFAQRRLRLEGIDEGFGALQMGDFAHGVFKSFYTHFQEEVALKVTPETMPQAQRIMAEVIDRHLAYQYDMKPTVNRLLPRTAFERRETEELVRKIKAFLPFEASFLPSYHPAYLEYDVSQGSTARYAGHALVGTADRIDVDDAGHAVILDYKASLSPEYDYAVRAESGIGKVQALIYAQVVRRDLGLDVVGALYARYGKTCSISGAYDARCLETPHLPGMKHDRCGVSPASGLSFADVLDQTEEAVALGIERMLSGDVRPNPQSEHACRYCPVLSCPKRIS